MKAVVTFLLIALGIMAVLAAHAETAEEIEKKYSYGEVAKTAQQIGTDVPHNEKEFEMLVNYRYEQEHNKLYESAMLSVCLLISLVIVLRFITSKPSYSATHIVNAAGLIFIIFGTIFLVLLTDSESQLTASMGIIGAVAGYLFGTMRRGEGNPDSEGKNS